MSLADACAVLVMLGLTAYAVLGGADFGTGLWELTAGRRRRREVHRLVESSMGPVWEANHVWLIFVLVVTWTAFPVAFGSVASTLYVPLFLAAVGIILRGAAFATRGVGGGPRARRWYGALFATSSLLTPFFLAAALGAIASGRVPVGNAAGDAVASWWNPTSVLAGAVAVATGAHLAAVYLAADARRTGRAELVEAFRARALASGVAAGALALGGLAVVREDARPLYDGLVEEALPIVVLSGAAGVATLVLVWRRLLGLARVTGALAVAAVLWGWAVAQSPALLPGELTIDEAAAGRPTLLAVLVSSGIGALVLVPSLAYLFRLVLRGRLDKDPAPGSGAPLP
ncbi:cytochrome d ubiquinol oxidase subunit II [Miltoncostaea marina]|uniref:cytochrome d ubiquinol oxidase subunit II n=1 Tax=Miltoncostaea marina TaxID=2843215 RepID=UPI001C3D9BA9|nr:cytochrome d ubiquinol oxidase subunit II [Miltoncostaea marina]